MASFFPLQQPLAFSTAHGEKGRSWQPCGDLRRLIQITTPDSYPLPNMMDMAAKMAGRCILSKVDL